MNEHRLKEDLAFLAGTLSHRGANTHNERKAAEYVASRLEAYCPEAHLDEFYSIESVWPLLAAFYGEFLFVALLTHWMPLVALVYGAVVFCLYLAELTGYRTVSRLLPQYETQNAVARFLAMRPRGALVVSAHYDSPKDIPLTRHGKHTAVRWINLILVLCMFAVLVSCMMDTAGLHGNGAVRIDWALRWSAAGVLGIASLLALYNGSRTEPACGANDNASGVALLLGLAERLQESPIENADVWLVATGSHSSWLNGMRFFMADNEFDRENSYFINVDSVGDGGLRFTTGEGLLHFFRSAPELLDIAERIAPQYHARPIRLREWPTDALIPLGRGFKTIGITAEPETTQVSSESSRQEGPWNVNIDTLRQAGAYVEAIMRETAARLPENPGQAP